MNPNQLSSEQIDQLRQWAAEGLDLNAMQKRMNEEMGLRLTYMDARFLLLDLQIELSSPKPAKDEEKSSTPSDEVLLPTGATQVTIDEITPPHALLCGKVAFMSGARGTWSIDKMGRIDWAPVSGEPTPDDLKGFEKELQKVLRSQMGGL